MARKPDPLYIPVPRKIDAALKDRWDIVRRCNRSRTKMVDFIISIGGYHGGRHDGPFAIEFNVAAYGAKLDADDMWALLCSDKIDAGPEKNLPPEHLAQVKALFYREHKEHEDHLWNWGAEEAYEGWRDSDTPYETWTGERVEWKFGLYGRGGKHLCMEECEGIDLKCSEEELEEKLMDRQNFGAEWTYSHEDVRKLFIICVQNSVELTPQAAAEEVAYRAAWRLWVSFVEDQVPAMIQAYEQRQQLGRDAGMIYDRLMGEPGLYDSFKTICTLADINIEE